MLRSLYAGVSGMRAAQTRMDVIGNNVANVNTSGFKAGRVTFATQISQTMSGAAAPAAGRGGANGLQVGLGVAAASIDQVQTQGNLQNTGRVTDLALQGNGFFVMGDGPSQTYTRSGAFDFDRDGNLVDPGSGLHVMGWMAQRNGNGEPTVETSGPLQAVRIPLGITRSPHATTSLTMQGNLDAATPVGGTFDTSTTIYDKLGNTHLVTLRYTHSAANTWDWQVLKSDEMGSDPTVTGGTLTFDANGQLAGDTAGATVDAGSAAVSFTLPDGSTTDVEFKPNMGVVGGGGGVTQFAGGSTVVTAVQDGEAPGELTGVTVDPSGVLHGTFSNGRSEALGQIAVATFSNPGGLQAQGGNSFVRTANSGDVKLRAAGTADAGNMVAGALEMSNVDLAQQFADMIVTQRGFQANSRIITTSDELLQELINLKH